ncbi:MAG: YhbY family RNA-binding protein [bacterium]
MTDLNPLALTGAQRRHLRALGHHLAAVIQIGQRGLTPALVSATAEALERHELIKLSVARDAPVERAEAVHWLARETGSHVAQLLGRTALLYRRRAQDPEVELPGVTVEQAPASAKGAKAKAISAAPRKATPGKAAPGKAAPRKAASGKAAPRAAAPGKAAPRAAAPGKAAPRKAAPGKAAPRAAAPARPPRARRRLARRPRHPRPRPRPGPWSDRGPKGGSR